MIKIIDNHIVITMPNDGDYNIPINNCNDYKSIMAWVIQLLEKDWITTNNLIDFIEIALKESDLKRPRI